MHHRGEPASCLLAGALDLTKQGSWPGLPPLGGRPAPLTGLFSGWQLELQGKNKVQAQILHLRPNNLTKKKVA